MYYIGDCVAHVEAAWQVHKGVLYDAHYNAYRWQQECLRQRRRRELVEAGEID
jgi:hypothetical protein